MPLKILMIIPSLPTGGAEWAFVRMANALSASHQVTVYVPYRCESSPALWSALGSGVRRLFLPLPHPWFHRLIYKLTLLWPKFSLESKLHRWVLTTLHRFNGYSVVNPHLMSGTELACKAFEDVVLPIIETDHGDYAIRKKQDVSMPDHHLIFSRVDAVACPSQANAAYLREFSWTKSVKIALIPYAAPQVKQHQVLSRSRAFSFGLVSRGVAEKGWAEALAAFREVQKNTSRPVRLVFVGDGPEITKLRGELRDSDSSIVFAGHQTDTSSWISEFDVGLLPSYFTAESLPNVVIECQAQGKPVIGTSVGGIPEMLEHEGSPCGILVPLNQSTGRADVDALASAMKWLMDDAATYQQMSACAFTAYTRYSPERCCAAYTALFEEVLAGSP